MIAKEYVQLVDEADRELGTMEKMEAHIKGALHRAISVFLFNSKGELLLQQRAESKYHSPGLWSNTCCTHPRPGEKPEHAAKRRLQEELGISCSVFYKTSVCYRASLGKGLIEYEYDHVYTGICDDEPTPDESEVSSWCYLSRAEADTMLKQSPGIFTSWFPILYEKLKPVI